MEIIYSFTTKLYIYENEHKRKTVSFRLFEGVWIDADSKIGFFFVLF